MYAFTYWICILQRDKNYPAHILIITVNVSTWKGSDSHWTSYTQEPSNESLQYFTSKKACLVWLNPKSKQIDIEKKNFLEILGGGVRPPRPPLNPPV